MWIIYVLNVYMYYFHCSRRFEFVLGSPVYVIFCLQNLYHKLSLHCYHVSLSYALGTYFFSLMCLQVVYTPGQQDKCFLCGQVGHLAANCEGKAKRKAGEFDEKGDAIVPKKPYQVIMTYRLL